MSTFIQTLAVGLRLGSIYALSYDTIAKIIGKDTKVFKEAVEYVERNSSVSEIILYLD